jgi:hypothetical protein
LEVSNVGVLVRTLLPRETGAELAQRAKARGTTLEEALRLALRAGGLALEIEVIKGGNMFMSNRVRFMEESIPEIKKEIGWLAAAIEQAERDRVLMERLLLDGGNSQSEQGPKKGS